MRAYFILIRVLKRGQNDIINQNERGKKIAVRLDASCVLKLYRCVTLLIRNGALARSTRIIIVT